MATDVAIASIPEGEASNGARHLGPLANGASHLGPLADTARCSNGAIASISEAPTATVPDTLGHPDVAIASIPEGEASNGARHLGPFLHRLLGAIHLVFGQAHDGGIRGICWFLELSRLDRFIAPSYGSQQKVASSIEKLLGQFGHEEDCQLATQMPHRDIALCEDETFHPQICLVAIEPVSNFLILEAYAEKRDAPTWNAAVDAALAPFSVTVTQCVSDQATALLSHAQSHLGVHHSPDVFHVQYEISKATSLALNRQTDKAKDALDKAQSEHQKNADKLRAFDQQWPSTLRELDQEIELIKHPACRRGLTMQFSDSMKLGSASD